MIQNAFILCVALTVASCCGSSTVQDGAAPFTGKVVIIGNEPFTMPALQTADGTIYRLQCVKAAEETLRGAQGKRVRLECSKVDSVAKELHVTQVVVLTEHQ